MINFDSLPTSKPDVTIPAGRYNAIVETAEMKPSKDPSKPMYLSIRFGILDKGGNRIGGVYDIISESEASLVRYKLQRFITALELPLKSFELKDLTKIVVGKKLEVDLKIEQNEGYAPRTVVDALTNEIYYPFIELPFDASDSADIAETGGTDTDNY